MQLKKAVKDSIDENVWRITNDRSLQIFMMCAFGLLCTVILYCGFISGFPHTDEYFRIADRFLSGKIEKISDCYCFPLTFLLLVPPRLVSPTPEIYGYIFGLYGFAFYMLGGHFMLKSCRKTGYCEKDAYLLLFLVFLCSLSLMLFGTGAIPAAFTILSLWYFHKENYPTSFVFLGLATMTGLYPVMLFTAYLAFLIRKRNLCNSAMSILIYLMICLVFLYIPYGSPTETFSAFTNSEKAYLAQLYDILGLDTDGNRSLIIGITVGAALTAITIFCTKDTSSAMGTAADAAFVGLTVLVLLSTAYRDDSFIWIGMLFPMTQMHACNYDRIAYVTFTAFCISELICLHTSPNGAVYESFSVIRAAALVLTGSIILYKTTSKKDKTGPNGP